MEQSTSVAMSCRRPVDVELQDLQEVQEQRELHETPDADLNSLTTVDLMNDSVDSADSGFPPTPCHSRTSSEGCADSWSTDGHPVSYLFPPMGISLGCSVWTPTVQDDAILEKLTSSLSSTRLEMVWESNGFQEWGIFDSWSPMPSPDEAEVLLEKQHEEEIFIHLRAAVKKGVKKDRYFERFSQQM